MTATDEQPDNALGRQLIRHAEIITQLRTDLDQLASEMTDVVADLMTRLESTESLWRELTEWVAWIRHRYPLAKRIPECWSEHPEVVEELTALWLAWNAAYTERDASFTAAVDWHDRWLPGVLHRIEHGAFALDCGHAHHERPLSAYAQSYTRPVP